MKRKFFECSKEGVKELERYYGECKNVLTIIKRGKMYITNGDDLTEKEKQRYYLNYSGDNNK